MSDHPPGASSAASKASFWFPRGEKKRERAGGLPALCFMSFQLSYISDRHLRIRSLRCREPNSESVEPKSLLKQLAGIFREDYRRPFDGLVCFGGCTVCGILAPVCVSVIAVAWRREESVNVAVACPRQSLRSLQNH